MMFFSVYGPTLTRAGAVALVGVAGYFAYRFLRKPMVTGNPHEMPKIVEQMTDTLELTSKILQPPSGERKAANPPKQET